MRWPSIHFCSQDISQHNCQIWCLYHKMNNWFGMLSYAAPLKIRYSIRETILDCSIKRPSVIESRDRTTPVTHISEINLHVRTIYHTIKTAPCICIVGIGCLWLGCSWSRVFVFNVNTICSDASVKVHFRVCQIVMLFSKHITADILNIQWHFRKFVSNILSYLIFLHICIEI